MPVNFNAVKRCLVLGLGKSGKSAVRALNEYFQIPVTVADRNPLDILPGGREIVQYYGARFYQEEELMENIDDFDLIIKSPGISITNPLIKASEKQGIKTLDEFELGYQILIDRFPQIREKLIAVTGTNGKTTTTELLTEIFKNNNLPALSAGNVGSPLSTKALEVSGCEYLILEVSSFQLQYTEDFTPHVAVILNITPDHLDWHGKHEHYIAAKSRIFMNQTEKDYTILNYDDEGVRSLNAKKAGKIVWFSRDYKENLDMGAYIAADKLLYRVNQSWASLSIHEFSLPGVHNQENILAACAACGPFQLSQKSVNHALKSFPGVAHRMEYVDKMSGVAFVNDSKGTNIEATKKAIVSYRSPVILIAGGKEKGADFTELAKAIYQSSVKKVVLLGETSERIKTALKKNGFHKVEIVDDLEIAVNLAYQQAVPGDIVLLSPACASWDMYPNFEARGEHFKRQVSTLGRRYNEP